MNFKTYYSFLFPDEIDLVEKKIERFEKNQDEIVECMLEYAKTRDKDILEHVNNNIMEEQVCYLKDIFPFMKKAFDRYCTIDTEIIKIENELVLEKKKERKTEKGKRQLEANILLLEQRIIELKRKQETKLDYPVFRYQFPIIQGMFDPYVRLQELEEENKRLRLELGKPHLGEIHEMEKYNSEDVKFLCKKVKKDSSEKSIKVDIVDKIKTINELGKKKFR